MIPCTRTDCLHVFKAECFFDGAADASPECEGFEPDDVDPAAEARAWKADMERKRDE